MAIFAGAVGGIVHEFAQSGGTIAFYNIRSDGVYLGSLAGSVLGAIAGILFFAGITNQDNSIIMVQSILAGISFKGISEAIGGQLIPQSHEQISLENTRYDITNNLIIVTIRNTSEIGSNIARIYVNSQPFDRQNIYILPWQSSDITVSNINPSLEKGKNYSIKIVTSTGMMQQANLSIM